MTGIRTNIPCTFRSFFGAFRVTSGRNCTRRFFDAMEVYFDAQCLEADSKGVPDMDSYIRFRRDASGCNPCFTLIEYANGLNLPDEVFEDPTIRTLQETANDIVSWSNVGLSLTTSVLLLTISARVGYRIVQYRTSPRRNSEHGGHPHGIPRDEGPRSREPRR